MKPDRNQSQNVDSSEGIVKLKNGKKTDYCRREWGLLRRQDCGGLQEKAGRRATRTGKGADEEADRRPGGIRKKGGG